MMTYFENIGRVRKRFLESYKQGDYLRAVIWGEKLLNEQKNNQKVETVEYADDLFNVARAYEALERYDKAISLYKESSKGIGKLFGEDFHIIRILNNLAVAYCGKGEYEKAQQLLKKACSLCEELQGKECAEYADILYNVANTYADLKDNDTALKLHFDVLAMRKKIDMDHVNSLNSICYIYEDGKDWNNAILYGEKSLSAIKKLSGQNMEELCRVKYYLAGLYESNNRYEIAIKLLRAVAKWMENYLGLRHPQYIGCVNRIADLYCKMEDMESALKLRQKTLRLIKDTAGESHIYYANLLKNTALLCKALNQRGKAESMMLQAVEIKRNLMGKDGFDYVDDLIMLIGFYVEWDMIEKASDTLIYTLDNIGGNKEELNGFMNELAKIFLSMTGTEGDESSTGEIHDFVQRAIELHDSDSIKDTLNRLQGKDIGTDG